MLACAIGTGCGGAASSAPAGAGSGAAGSSSASCQPGAELTGGTYDVSKSKFAFGSPPTREDSALGTRYVGKDGAMLVSPNGSVIAILNGGAPEASLPGLPGDEASATQHAKDYLATMGVDPCQIQSVVMLGGGSGGGPTGSPGTMTSTFSTASANRAIDSIMVAQSLANAEFKAGDVTVMESFYWPTIPADVVTKARAFRDRLKDPTELAAYRAKLPAGAQGDGQVVIAHTGSLSSGPFRAMAVWYVLVGGSSGSNQPFDENGAPAGQF